MMGDLDLTALAVDDAAMDNAWEELRRVSSDYTRDDLNAMRAALDAAEALL